MRISKQLNLMLAASLVFAIGSTAGAATLFSDNFDDLALQSPTFASAGVNWVVESGSAGASVLNAPAGFFGAMDGTLMFDSGQATIVSVNFGETLPSTPVEARFKLHQANGAGGAYYGFIFGFANSATGQYYRELGTLSPSYYGGGDAASGFEAFYGIGDNDIISGTPGAAYSNIWNFLKMRFDPAAGIQIWQATTGDNTLSYDNSALSYTMVASWSNVKNISSVDKFFLNNNGGVVSWKVDDVEIQGTAAVPEPGSLLAVVTGLSGLLVARRKRS